MKVSPEHFEAMKAAIEPLDLPEYRDRYKRRDIARNDYVQDINKRYRWDLYWFAARKGYSMPDSTNGYNMAHIDTALRKIVPDIE
jgi:hypothetical protein